MSIFNKRSIVWKKKRKKENRLTHGSSWKQNMKYDSILFSVFTEYLLCL